MKTESEVSFLDIFDAIPDVMGLQDTDRRVLMYNEAGYRYFNLAPEEVIGRYCYEIIGRDGPCPECATGDAVRTGLPTSVEKYVPENGTWLNVRAYPIKDNRGNVVQVVEHLRDVTESKVLQLELERLNRNLEKQVDARTMELQKTVENLTATQDKLIESEKLSALGRMVAGFSHEINTPLGVARTSASFVREKIHDAGIDGGNEVRMEDLPAGFFDDLTQACSLVNRNLQRAGELISGFKRIAADQTSEKKRDICPHYYLEDLILSLHHELKIRNVTARVTGDDLARISTYPGALSQVFSNLIMNTVTHVYPDGGEGRIDIDVARHPESGITVTYVDDCCGMDPITLERMYEPFFTTRIGSGGIGLGMNIVYNLTVGKLEGSISCDSRPGKGTAFTLLLPDLAE